jgi:hypothetical protein
MKVEHYSFGKITIDGQPYSSDVIIYPERVDSSWRRKQGHILQIEDIAGLIKAEPGVVIIGTGYFGLMKVPNETVLYLEAKGIMVYVERTGKAVELFNELQKNKTVIAALHLTC